MDFLDKLSDVAATLGNDVAKKGKKVSEVARLQYQIHVREGYLNELYQELGKRYYSEHKNEEDQDFDEITSVIEELGHLRKELGERKGVDKCPQCGYPVAVDADYCSKCGKQLKGVEVEVDFDDKGDIDE